MKNFIYFVTLFVMSCFYACEQDPMFETNENLQANDVHTRAAYFCSGNGGCLPTVSIYGDQHSAMVSWNSQTNNDHTYILTCSGMNGYVFRSLKVGASGLWVFNSPTPETKGYKLSYTIRCLEEHCDECKKSGSYNQPADPNEPGTMGSFTQCFKKYMNFYMEMIPTNYNTYAAKLYYSPSFDTEHYLKITHYKTRLDDPGEHSETSWETEWSSYAIPLERLDYHNFITGGLPYKENKDYEVMLLSKNCEFYNEHYVWFRYHCQFGRISIQSGIQEINNH